MKDYRLTSKSKSNIVPFCRSTRLKSVSQSDRSTTTWRVLLKKAIHQIWQAIAIILPLSDEPQIYQKHDHQGNVYFHVYDPVTNSSFTFHSEQEVLVWLDERFYHR